MHSRIHMRATPDPNEIPVVPGDKAKATFVLSNIGNETANGITGLNFYLSEDNLWDGSDISLADLGGIKLKNFGSGAEKSIKGKLVIPTNVPTGNYYLIAVVDPENTFAEADESIPSNVIIEGAQHSLAWKFGEISGRKKVKLTVFPIASSTKKKSVCPGSKRSPS